MTWLAALRHPWHRTTALLPWLAGLLALWTITRGLAAPQSYALSQWMLDYRVGFAKRALVGTLVEPLLRYKTAAEVELVLLVLVLGVFFAVVAALAWSARGLVRGAGPEGRILAWSAVLVLASSPWLVVLANTVGFQDHLLVLVTLAGVAGARRGHHVLVAALIPVGLAMHEAFLLTGLPVVLFALCLQGVRDVEAGAPRARVLARGGGILAWTALSAGVMALAVSWLDEADRQQLLAHVIGYGVYGQGEVGTMIEHVPGVPPGSWSLQVREFFVQRLARPDVVRIVYPPAVLLTALSAWLLARSGRTWLVLPLVGVVLLPLGLQAVAWDTTRFASMTTFHAWAALVAVVAILRPSLAHGRRAAVVAVGAAALVGVNSAVWPVELLKRQLDGDGPFSVRWTPSAGAMRGCAPVVARRVWRASGAPFHADPVGRTQIRPRSDPGGSEGRLLSGEFPLDGELLMVAVSGRRAPDEAHIALLVDGEEQLRASPRGWLGPAGHGWDTRPWRGRSARLEIVDARASERGNVQVSGPCWRQPTATER